MEGICTVIMEKENQQLWIRDALDSIFEAFACSSDVKNMLIFKGARILNMHLHNKGRMSLDIDSNVSYRLLRQNTTKSSQAEAIATTIQTSLQSYFLHQKRLRYQLSKVTIFPKPPKEDHPFGWNGFELKINLIDNTLKSQRGVPSLKIDIAYPEELTDNSICTMPTLSGEIKCYSLERITGEKMRAYLSTLPEYCNKIGKIFRDIRVKDVYDLSKILRYKPITDIRFWNIAGKEFKVACSSRYIDCQGITSFQQNISKAKMLYQGDKTIPKDISCDQAFNNLNKVIETWEKSELLNFRNDPIVIKDPFLKMSVENDNLPTKGITRDDSISF